jgi:hypothetical protein
MKKYIIYSFILVSLWFMTIGMKCETRQVEIPVLGNADNFFQIEEVVSSYYDDFEINLFSELERVAKEKTFNKISAVYLQGITYIIQDNESAPGTIINGTINVSDDIFYRSMSPLIEMTNVNLDAVVGVVNTPPLIPEGVLTINDRLSPYLYLWQGDHFTLYFSLNGTATPAPSTAHPLKFKILIKVYFNLVGVLDADVPVM